MRGCVCSKQGAELLYPPLGQEVGVTDVTRRNGIYSFQSSVFCIFKLSMDHPTLIPARCPDGACGS